MVADRDDRHARCRRGERVVELDLAGHKGRAAGRLNSRHHFAATAADNAHAARRARGLTGNVAARKSDTGVGCATLVTGEIKLHDALAATAASVSVVAVGHHASERFSMGVLAERLAERAAGLTCFASRADIDPLVWLQ
jgi:hypothetical protein